MAPPPLPHAAGLVMVDAEGQIGYAAGVGTDKRVAALIANRAWLDGARSRRLVALEMDRKRYLVLSLRCRFGTLLVISDGPTDTVFEFVATVDFAYDILNHLLTDPFNAMTVVDDQARLAFISPVHEAFFGLEHGAANGKPVRTVIPNTRLDQVVSTGKAEIGALQRMKGQERVVSRTPILRGDKVVGAIGRVMFKDAEQVQALSRQVNALEREVEFYRRESAALQRRHYGTQEIVGESAGIQRLREAIAKIAPLDIPVLIVGESGTGKELVAHALHRLSARARAPLVTVNAAALPASLVEAELFGYEPGSFTGADRKGRIGKFERADHGTIFLDEIGDMPMEVQVKLLRVLQDRQVERVGGNRAREMDFRLISATNRNLEALVADGHFRMDLYYRISPIVLEVPPLAERREDISLLIQHVLKEVAERHGRPVPEVEPGVYELVAGMSWPGNVRQLRHAVERAFVFAEGRITRAAFARERASQVAHGFAPPRPEPALPVDGPIKDHLGRLEGDLIRDALARFNGNKKRVAGELGVSRSYLYKRLKELNL